MKYTVLKMKDIIYEIKYNFQGMFTWNSLLYFEELFWCAYSANIEVPVSLSIFCSEVYLIPVCFGPLYSWHKYVFYHRSCKVSKLRELRLKWSEYFEIGQKVYMYRIVFLFRWINAKETPHALCQRCLTRPAVQFEIDILTKFACWCPGNRSPGHQQAHFVKTSP